MKRKHIIDVIFKRLATTSIVYEVIHKNQNEFHIKFDTNQEWFPSVGILEDSLRDEGIEFDTGYDIKKQQRIWQLDYSLTVNGKPLGKDPTNAKKEIEYKVGDIIQIPLDEKGHKGFGRILIEDSPLIFVEFYKIVSVENVPMETFRNMDWFLRRYTGDMGIVTEKTWKVIGNIPVSEFTMPLFWLKDPIGRICLFIDPLHQRWDHPRETTPDEINRLRAQEGTLAGHKAMELSLARELQKEGLL